ncbi:hypothetical protein ACFXK6_002767 [Citrobacter koseri]|uniref:hypothetical protein n=1 Tax=Citrobacter koseri TaxID=545 RepID=UPI0023AF1F35|nr:hypothetical protein [Citrobacter koseri]HBZ0728769.1 hypothetical protein [Klebsiella pneumoniae]
MVMLVCGIWSVIGVGVIALALYGVIYKSAEEKLSNDDDIMSIKKRLFKIEEKLNTDCDDD